MSERQTEPMLKVTDLHMQFGGIRALNKINFEVEDGSITALIGPNGAGKTTVFNCVTGFYRATSGNLVLNNQGKITDLGKVLGEKLYAEDLLSPGRFVEKMHYKLFGGSHRVARAGIARTFQNIRLFREMTAIENLLVAQHMVLNRNPIAAVVRTPGFKKLETKVLQHAEDWLRIVDLEEDSNRLAGELPYGHQRRLEIARAMCTDPSLICLDEPAAGLNPIETKELSQLITKLRNEHDVTVLLIEHDMSLVMDISEHIVVLDHGEVIADGKPEDIEKNPAVLAAYLGTEEEEVEEA